MLTIGTSVPSASRAAAARVTVAWSKHASRDDRVVPGHDANDVLDRLPGVEPDLLAPRVDRMPTQLDDRHLHRVTRSVGRLLEDQRGSLPGERAVQRLDRLLCQIEDRRDFRSA